MAEHQERAEQMADIKFNCPHCDKRLVVDEAGVRMTIVCPNCSKSITPPMWLQLMVLEEREIHKRIKEKEESERVKVKEEYERIEAEKEYPRIKAEKEYPRIEAEKEYPIKAPLPSASAPDLMRDALAASFERASGHNDVFRCPACGRHGQRFLGPVTRLVHGGIFATMGKQYYCDCGHMW